MTLLRKFFGRSLADQALLVRALVYVCGVRLGLWVLPYRTVQRAMERPVAVPKPGVEAERTHQRRVVGSVEAIGRRLLGDKPCLVQALVAQRFMREGGYDTALRIGVAKDGRELLAHAWLERNGRIIIGGASSPLRYQQLGPVHSQPA